MDRTTGFGWRAWYALWGINHGLDRAYHKAAKRFWAAFERKVGEQHKSVQYAHAAFKGLAQALAITFWDIKDELHIGARWGWIEGGHRHREWIENRSARREHGKGSAEHAAVRDRVTSERADRRLKYELYATDHARAASKGKPLPRLRDSVEPSAKPAITPKKTPEPPVKPCCTHNGGDEMACPCGCHPWNDAITISESKWSPPGGRRPKTPVEETSDFGQPERSPMKQEPTGVQAPENPDHEWPGGRQAIPGIRQQDPVVATTQPDGPVVDIQPKLAPTFQAPTREEPVATTLPNSGPGEVTNTVEWRSLLESERTGMQNFLENLTADEVELRNRLTTYEQATAWMSSDEFDGETISNATAIQEAMQALLTAVAQALAAATDAVGNIDATHQHSLSAHTGIEEAVSAGAAKSTSSYQGG